MKEKSLPSAPSVDRRLRFVRTSTRRLKEYADLVTLLQALSNRSRTYVHTEADRNFLFAVWRYAINNVRKTYGYPVVPLTVQESLLVKQFEETESDFRFPDDSINDKNRKFHELGESRLNKILLQLTRLESFASYNYNTNIDEVGAMMTLLEDLYKSTLLEFEPNKPMQDYTHTLAPVTYTVLSLNVKGVAGTHRAANLMDDVWKALTKLEQLPDILLFNEFSKANPGYSDFDAALQGAGYRTFSDPRPAVSHSNECFIAAGPRLVLPTTKVEVLFPEAPSGLDYLAIKFDYLETPTVILAYRLHEYLTKTQQDDIRLTRLNAIEANYQSIADALPQLQALIASFDPENTQILAAGDNNHGAVRASYDDGYAQKPASMQQQAKALASLGVNYLTPQKGSSFLPAHTPIDHILTTDSVTAENLAYEVLPSRELDHAAITADVQFRLKAK